MIKDIEVASDDERAYASRKPRKCPSCGGKPIAMILYGLPMFSAELEAQIESGKIALGGCCITDDDPTWECSHCGLKIYKRKS